MEDNLAMYDGPGKFEGELALAPLAYGVALDGFGEEYDFGSDGFVDHYTVCEGAIEVTDDEKAELGLSDADVAFAANLLGFIVHKDNSGFVSVSWYEKGEETRMASAVGKLDDRMAQFEMEED